jgi:hypothetical protein
MLVQNCVVSGVTSRALQHFDYAGSSTDRRIANNVGLNDWAG